MRLNGVVAENIGVVRAKRTTITGVAGQAGVLLRLEDVLADVLQRRAAVVAVGTLERLAANVHALVTSDVGAVRCLQVTEHMRYIFLTNDECIR